MKPKLFGFKALPMIQMAAEGPLLYFCVKLSVSQKTFGFIHNFDDLTRPSFHDLRVRSRWHIDEVHEQCHKQLAESELGPNCPSFNLRNPTMWLSLLSNYFQREARLQIIKRLREVAPYKRTYASTRYFGMDKEVTIYRFVPSNVVEELEDKVPRINETFMLRQLEEMTSTTGRRGEGSNLRQLKPGRRKIMHKMPAKNMLPPHIHEDWNSLHELKQKEPRFLAAPQFAFHRYTKDYDETQVLPARVGYFIWAILVEHHLAISSEGNLWRPLEPKLDFRMPETYLVRPEMPTMEELWDVFIGLTNNYLSTKEIPTVKEVLDNALTELTYAPGAPQSSEELVD